MSLQAHITLPEIAAELGITLSGVEKAVRKMQQQGEIRRSGSRKDGTWEVLQ